MVEVAVNPVTAQLTAFWLRALFASTGRFSELDHER